MWEGRDYAPVPTIPQRVVATDSKHNRVLGYLSICCSTLLWSPHGPGLNLGQSTLPRLPPLHLIHLTRSTSSCDSDYFTVIVVCIVTHVPLIDNPNRAGRLPGLHPPSAMLTLGRLPRTRTAPSRLPICDEEFASFSSSGTRPWT